MPESVFLAYITPILKKIDKSLPENYRPISLTNHLTKTFERVLRKEIVNHMELNDLMNKTQHGFRKGFSTITQILLYYDSMLQALENESNVDSVYLDFSKAFDKVDHEILLKKVENLGIQGKILAWIKLFLKNRQQQVRIGNCLSKKEWVKSGVPQGSVLGPLLFLIMVIDISDDIKYSLIGSYADDTRVWKCITGRIEQNQLQSDLNELYNWATKNNMTFNDDKFELITFGHPSKRNFKTPSGEPVKRKDHVKDLGIYMSSNCTFDHHIEEVIKGSTRMKNWVLRTFRIWNKFVMRTHLKSIIIPKAEYGCILWSPTSLTSINRLETLQKSFTSRIEEYQTYDQLLKMPRCTTNYWDRLKDLNLYSLERRRERYIIIYMYKFIIGFITLPTFEIDMGGRGIKVQRKFNQAAPKKVRNLRKNSFFYRGPQLYNLLPISLRQPENITIPAQTNVNQFKKKLDEFLATIPDQPTAAGLVREAETNSLIHQIQIQARK